MLKIRETAVLPEYQTTGAAAADVHACLDEPMILQPMERKMMPTGIALAIPNGYEVQLRARSGLSIKHGITMVNGVGTIDSDYRGEVGVLMINLGQEAFTVEPGMRIAQMVLSKCEQIEWQPVDVLDETVRGIGGYGSTGLREV
ncbi:MAG: Deoxyuridine 5'-triphosphate nucleotidohydrolase Dut [Candidatus Saccharibacteria bacterium GW2011_GWC2_48_9]|nr:MAG: Deoxyuridine 5'-triphosphate nucleotidohydrolase Dut [Candidatus Saccharibacteria bacterium GW2011_GWC2_48_9]